MSQQNSSQKYALTEGDILKKLLLVALPIMGTQLMMMTYNLTDMFWLGRLSSDAVAASGSAGMYMWLAQGFLMIARMGAEIGVAQYIGRGDRDGAKRYCQNALFLGLTIGLCYGGALLLFNRQLIGFFNIQEAHVAADAASYLATVGFGIPVVFITGAVTGTFNASGNSRIPFLINSTGLVINMILDPLMIFTLDLGIVGAALATITGQSFVCALSVLALTRHKDRPFVQIALFTKPDSGIIRQIFRWCVPIGLESMLFTFLAMIVSRFVAGWGAQAMTVQRVGSQIESLSWLLGAGLGSAFTAFVGQNYGANKFGRIHRGFLISAGCGCAWGTFVSLVLFFMGGALYGVFVRDDAIIAMGVAYMRILAFCQIPASVEGVSAGAFKGMGKTLPPTIISISCNAFRVPLAYVLSQTALGLNGIWLGITIGAAARGILMFVWYRIHAKRLPSEDDLLLIAL